MITEHDMQELLAYSPDKTVVSLYLNIDPAEGSAEVHRLHLRSLLKDIETRKDVQVIERFFDHEFNWSGQSVALFSCATDHYFRPYPLAVPIRSQVQVGKRPHVKPLADALDAYGGYGVVLVDKQGARFFYFHLGELREQESFNGESVRRTKRGGGSQAPGRRGGTAGQTRYTEEVTERNMKEAADLAAEFFQVHRVRRVLIGGTDDNVALFRSLLPKSWQSLIVGDFPINTNASHKEVLERAMKVGAEAEKRREAQLVKSVITGAAKGRGGVVRLDDTLSAVHEGRVQTLLICEGFHAPGFRCRGCSYLTIQEISTCPFCGNTFGRITDAVELAVRKVLHNGGDVEVLQQSPELEKAGNIGALLRY
ncbi:MAG: hypothetical protein AB1345_00335 [Chloroflexota bacterium]